MRSVGDTIIGIAELAEARKLRAEAQDLIRARGSNPYADYLLKHYRRPGRKEAAAIGRLLGEQVRASDGSLQPKYSQRERALAKKAGLQKAAENDKLDQLIRLRSALASLAKNDGDPADIIRQVDPLFGDESAIREQLSHAVRWLNRFATEWDREQGPHRGQG
jgi:hypothetical protein